MQPSGDGYVDPGEVCDDGNRAAGDGCRADCRGVEVCGDGLVDSAAGEQCDDGGTTAGDGCDATCQLDAFSNVPPTLVSETPLAVLEFALSVLNEPDSVPVASTSALGPPVAVTDVFSTCSLRLSFSRCSGVRSVASSALASLSARRETAR